ncbi:hypothetical protein HJFPF1_07600 [Paramyrothecium foliicola]|nr:hypothetical protein HJFPF1_07600 [Paramyrothecium foliicola]
MVSIKYVLTCLAGASVLNAAALPPRSDRQTGTVKWPPRSDRQTGTVKWSPRADRETGTVKWIGHRDTDSSLDARQKSARGKKVDVIKAATP